VMRCCAVPRSAVPRSAVPPAEPAPVPSSKAYLGPPVPARIAHGALGAAASFGCAGAAVHAACIQLPDQRGLVASGASRKWGTGRASTSALPPFQGSLHLRARPPAGTLHLRSDLILSASLGDHNSRTPAPHGRCGRAA
jgi:hypothetical protein